MIDDNILKDAFKSIENILDAQNNINKITDAKFTALLEYTLALNALVKYMCERVDIK